jgi:bacillopeptidase F (M6 metalloprotease family)
MRDLNLLPPKNMLPKNFRTTQTEMKVEIIDFKQVNTMDQKLSADNADNLYLEFIDFLLENMIFDLADSLL